MLNKLAFRNMKRSARDYLVYLLTMTLVTALLYTFNSLLFQNELRQYWNDEGMLEMTVSLATVLVVLIMAWLVGYMVRFMMGKRGEEFGIYLLLGMKKSMLSKLYLRENILLGGISLLFGTALGILLQQILMTVLFSLVEMTWHLHIRLHPGTVLMTVFCFGACFLLSLFRCRRKFNRMTIRGLIEEKRRNEEIREDHVRIKQALCPLSVLSLFLFRKFFRTIENTGDAAFFLIGLVVTIYLFYIGLSAWITCYIRKGGERVYRGQNLFLLRQFASRIRRTQFTMGTLTVLFTLALMGASFALMFSAWQNRLMGQKFPFDILLYSPDPTDTFDREIQFLQNRVMPLEVYPYRIYTDGDNRVNSWMLTHLTAWGAMFQNPDGTPDVEEIEKKLTNESTYCTYDTYMGLTDYNRLRSMLGYEQISLENTEYAVQIKPRLEKEVQNIGDELLLGEHSTLTCGGIHAEPFSQDGHNGGDYLIIVPDEELAHMYPYHAELAMDIDGAAPSNLRDELDNLRSENLRFPSETDPLLQGNRCFGSDTLIVFNAINEVKDNLRASAAYMMASLIIPLFYISLVFLCVAVTVLSVQQLSDAAACKLRYDILSKLGLKQTDIRRLILKQLAAYYLCPALLAILICSEMVLFAGKRFVMMTGVPVSSRSFFLESIALFFGVYVTYFAVTYISFCRNIEK